MGKYDIGPKLGIDGEPEFRRAIQNINENIRTLGTEMLAVTSAYDANDKSMEALTNQNKVLVKQIDAQKEKLAKLQEGLAASTEKYGENDEKTQRWQQTVNKATAELNQMERQLQQNTRELDGNTEEVAENTGELKKQDSALGGLNDRLKTVGAGFAAAAKAAAAGIAAASAAVGALVKSSIDGFAEYEQLVGGVETLFQSSSDTVVKYANDAYKTAGLSANEYMETVTGFSASLLQSLDGDTAKAAAVADQAITDMSDNANKMGSDMETIQNAYQGFAKQNYTMLDNLKLGYGGTKEEMERLLSDAEKLSGQKFDLSSYSDIIEAIHVVQTEMGITGTTATEASTTIQGSIGAMGSAWGNLVTGLAGDSQNLDQLISNFVDSALTVANNIVPVVETILANIGTVITTLTPVITEQLPQMIEGILPSLLEAGVQLIQGVAAGVMSALPELQAAAGEAFTGLIGFLRENLPQMISSGLEALLSFSAGFRENVGALVDNAIELIMTLADGVIKALPDLIATVPEIVSNFANAINDNAPKLLASAAELIAKLVKGLIDNIPVIIQNIPKIIGAIVDTFSAFNWLNIGKTIATGLGNGLKSMVSFLKNIAGQLVEAVKGRISALPQAMLGIGKNIVSGLWNGINAMKDWVLSKIKSFVGGIVSSVKGLLGIQSPSKVFAGIGGYMAEGLGEGFGDEMDTVKRRIDRSMEELAGNAAASVQVSAGVSGQQAGGAGSYLAELPALIAAAVRQELDGAGVYLNQRKVGELMTSWQSNQARAMGV